MSETRETLIIRNAKADAVGIALADGTLRIYEELSVPPTFGGNPGILLVSIDLPTFSPAVDGVISEDLLETVIGDTGTANWYRCYSSTAEFLLDGPCYQSGDPDPPVGGLALTTTSFFEGLTLTGTFTYTSLQQS